MPLRRRRPLLRAAAVGGGAYMAGKRSARLEEAEAQQPEPYPQAPPPQYAAPPPAPASSGISTEALEKIKQLAQLHDQGVLTDEEFAAEKAQLLR
jgi:hypothetical protein